MKLLNISMLLFTLSELKPRPALLSEPVPIQTTRHINQRFHNRDLDGSSQSKDVQLDFEKALQLDVYSLRIRL
jgi:hypothetical protein